MIDPAAWDLSTLAARWLEAQPFPYLLVDDLLAEDALASLRQGIAREPHWPNRSEIFEMMASGPPSQPAVQAFFAALGSAAVLAAVGAVSGRTLTRVDGNSYVYLAHSYLLPHTDHRPGVDRQIAWVFYLSPREAFAGGELDLYRCDVAEGSGGEIIATEVALTVAPLPNRLVLFDVGPTTLHQVREVLQGARVSLAGWFY